MSRDGSLSVLLAEAGAPELVELVDEHLARLDVDAARQALKNPHATREVIERLVAHKGLMTSRELRRDIAAHRQTPEPVALRMVSTLFWRDLLGLGSEIRVRPTVRRAADRALSTRLGSMSVGERVVVARRAGPGVAAQLRHDADRRVISALLDNPRTTEGLLAPLLANDRTRPDVLEAVIAHPRWGSRYTVRAQFCRNPRSPATRVLQELAMLRKVDLQALSADPRIAPAVRKRADLLLGRAG